MQNVNKRLKDEYVSGNRLASRVDVHRRFSTNLQGFYSWLFDHIDIPGSAKILELGCGNGDFWLENRDEVPGTWRMLLTDFSQGMIDSTSQRLAILKNEMRFEVLDANSHFPYSDESYDCVIANHILYHLEDLNRTLGEISRVLKPGGTLLASTNGEDHLKELKEVIEEAIPGRSIPSSPFSLENGMRILQYQFSTVNAHRYKDSMIIDQESGLREYISSLFMLNGTSRAEQEKVLNVFISQLHASGCVKISKASGAFVAKRKSREEENIHNFK